LLYFLFLLFESYPLYEIIHNVGGTLYNLVYSVYRMLALGRMGINRCADFEPAYL